MNESFVAADVNCTSQGTPSLACITAWTLMPPFFLPVFGWRPTPLKMALENRLTVVESMMRSRFIHSSVPLRRLSDERMPLLVSYRSRYTSSKNFSERRHLHPTKCCVVALYQSRHDAACALPPSWRSLSHAMNRTAESPHRALSADECSRQSS